MRPDFIPKEVFRAHLTAGELNKHARIDGVLAGSYVARCEREGKPLPYLTYAGSRRWRLLDIVARARAHAQPIAPSHQTALVRDIAELEAQKAELTADLAARKHELALQASSSRLTGATLLTEAEIAAGRMHIPVTSGVYFLLQGERVVYVGQSVSVFRRVLDHLTSKSFDGFAYVPCERGALDTLESLYIHALRPELNGKWSLGQPGMHAPLRLDSLLKGASS